MKKSYLVHTALLALAIAAGLYPLAWLQTLASVATLSFEIAGLFATLVMLIITVVFLIVPDDIEHEEDPELMPRTKAKLRGIMTRPMTLGRWMLYLFTGLTFGALIGAGMTHTGIAYLALDLVSVMLAWSSRKMAADWL